VDPFPQRNGHATTLHDIVQNNRDLTSTDRGETALSKQQIDCIEHWNKLLERIPPELGLPSFPIWGDEIGARYPFESRTPHATPLRELRKLIYSNGHSREWKKQDFLNLLPNYAREPEPRFPDWKVAFIKQNRDWFHETKSCFSAGWITALKEFPASLRKLEWNCKGEERNLWQHVLQFRPSGLRAKRYSSSPALVAMTTTQIPILGPKHRFLTRVEGLRLQGFPDSHQLPESRSSAFAALGNAVHVELVKKIARSFLEQTRHTAPRGNGSR